MQPCRKHQEPNPARTHLVGASHHSGHQGNLAFRFKITHSNIAYANHCIPTLRVTSRNGSRLIRYEPQQAEVRRPAHKGLEAPRVKQSQGEITKTSPSGPAQPRSEADWDISNLFSFDSNPEPNPQNLHRGEASGPPEPIKRLGHLSGGGLRSCGVPPEGSSDPISK